MRLLFANLLLWAIMISATIRNFFVTAYYWYTQMRDNSLIEQTHEQLHQRVQKQVCCEPLPIAVIIDSQSVKMSEKG